jgi:hypothetical protein
MAGAPRFVYQGWMGSREICEIRPPDTEGPGTVVFGGDAFFEADFCKSEDSFICIFARDIAFAVPRTLGAQTQWEFRGHTFEVADRDLSVRLFGTEISGLLHVRTPPSANFSYEPDQRQFNFLYSPEIGLVAFGWVHARGSSFVYWTQARRGFGSIGE